MSSTSVHSEFTEALSGQLLSLVRVKLAPSAQSLVQDALTTALGAHHGHTRKQGGPYIVHPLRVTISLLQDFGVKDVNVVVAALLHDVLEDCPDRVATTDIKTKFGQTVAELVVALTCPEDARRSEKEEQARRKVEQVLAGPRDARLIKLVDRIDNLRDACRLDNNEASRQFRLRYQHETTEYYVPMAETSGNEKLLAELLQALADLRNVILRSK